MVFFIYGLFSDKDGIIRYIGKTNSIKSRLASHKYDAITKQTHNHKCNWIRSVYNEGNKIEITIIEECTEYNIDEREKYWIKFLKDKNELVNELEGGQSGGLGGKLQEYKTYEELKLWLKENYPNVKTYKEYKKIPKRIKYENCLPLSPQRVYVTRKEWKGWDDLLCTGKVRVTKKLTKEEIIQEIRKFDIRSYKEYNQYAKSNPNLPNSLQEYCKNNNIEYDFDLFFGKVTKNVTLIKNILHKEKIGTRDEYQKQYKHLLRKYDNIVLPYHLDRSLHVKWCDVLYKENISEKLFKRYVNIYYSNIKTVKEWITLSKCGKLNQRIPKRPDIKYGKPWSFFFKNIKKHK